MSAPKKWRIALLVVPVMTMSLGCTAGRPILVGDSVPADRMMAIGQTFERQGRFSEAQYVYQQILDQDPISPAAERLLAVIAASDVTEAQDLPVERLMSVGQFYERHGDIGLAQGVYSQILHRDPEYRPARARLDSIAAHQGTIVSQVTPRGVQKGRSTAGTAAMSTGSASKSTTAEVAEAAPSFDRSLVASTSAHASTDPKTNQWKARQPHSSQAEPARSPEADDSNTAYELPEIAVQQPVENHRRVRQASGEDGGPRPGQGQLAVPPAPGEGYRATPTISPVPDQGQGASPKADNRVTELWQDKPLGQLKASIALKFPESERLRDTEVQRLTQATPHLVSRGTLTQTVGQSRPWMLASYEWEAPATRHLPLWFEEPNLERMGYTCGMQWNVCGYQSGPYAAECLQPFVSAGHFFGRVPFIPYMCGIDPPCEPVYTLGVDRPGSPVPYRRYLIPVTLKAALFQAGAMVGVAYAVP